VPAFSDPANGYLVEFNNSVPNGGGAYINQFTVLFDLLIPGSLNWTALFNTNPGNENDADWYVAADGSLGIGALGYSAVNVIQPGTWHRVAFAADLGAGVVKFYVDGNLVRERTGGSLLDGRFSLYSPIDQLPSLLLFNEGDGSGVYTHELYVSSFAFTDRTMGSDEIAVLGGPKALGIFVTSLPPISVSNESGLITLHWTGSPNVRLQKTASLNPPDWQDVPNTVGTDSYSEPATADSAFYRLIR
jgi:hypothetical protein